MHRPKCTGQNEAPHHPQSSSKGYLNLCNHAASITSPHEITQQESPQHMQSRSKSYLNLCNHAASTTSPYAITQQLLVLGSEASKVPSLSMTFSRSAACDKLQFFCFQAFVCEQNASIALAQTHKCVHVHLEDMHTCTQAHCTYTHMRTHTHAQMHTCDLEDTAYVTQDKNEKHVTCRALRSSTLRKAY